MSVKDFCVYVIAQICGGFVGGVLFFGICKMGDVQLLGNACNGVVGGTVDVGGVIGTLLTEIVLTCIFVYTILNVTDAKAGTGKIAGVVIGLTLTLVHLVGIRLTGTSVNPARSIATAFADLIYNGSTEALAQVWMFIVAPLIGAVVSALLYKAINTEKE